MSEGINYIKILREAYWLAMRPDFLDFVFKELDREIKGDYPAKAASFFGAASAYINPINVLFGGEPSIGKSYIAVIALSYFPEEDVWFLGRLSPTAIIHDTGYAKLVDENGQEIDLFNAPKKSDFESKEEYREAIRDWRNRLKKAKFVMDMKGKILLFLDAPHHETFQMLLPILSHDRKEIEYKITEKLPGGMHKTFHFV